MPVVVNANTGLAEDLPDPLATQSLRAGTHHVALNDPQGNPVTAPFANVPDLLQSGYSQPTPDQLTNLLRYAHFSSPSETAKTFAEGAGQASTFGATTAGEVAAGASPQDISDRRATNPIAHELGQMAGLVGSELTGVGEAAVLGRAGNALTGALGMTSRVGSRAVQEAVTMAGIQGGDEASKMILGQADPAAPVQTALTHMALSGLIGGGIGGAFGALSPIWKSANETKLGQYLQALRDKADGAGATENDLPFTEAPSLPNETRVDDLARRSGIEVTPVMRAALSSNPEWGERFRTLIESATGAGKEAQGALRDFVQSIHDKTLQALGVTPEQVTTAQTISDHDLGKAMMDAIAKDTEMDLHPLADAFAETKKAYQELPIGEGIKRQINDAAWNLANENGYFLEGTPENRLLQNFFKWVDHPEDLQGLRVIYTTLGRQTEDPKLWKIGTELSKIIDDAEQNVVERQLAIDRPEMVGKNSQDRAAYSSLMDDVRRISQRLHPGAFAGPDSFLTQLSKMPPEMVLRRLTPAGDANLLEIAQKRFPSLVEPMREAYMNSLIRAGAAKAKDPYLVQPFRIFDQLTKWSPELKKFALPAGAEDTIAAAKELSALNPYRANSLTAKNLDSMWSKIPGGAMAMVSMAHGDNPLWGYIMGEGGRLVAREAPDAMTLATLKLLGDPKPVEPGAFKNMVDYIYHTIQGETRMGKAVKAIFKSGAEVLPENLYPTPKARTKIKDRLASLELNPGEMLGVGGNLGYYMPEQAMSMAETAQRAASTLATMAPSRRKLGMLSPARVPSKAEEAAFDNAINIAEQPLVVLPKIKNGTLTNHDVQLIKQIYPALHARMSQKLMDEVIGTESSGQVIPYGTRLALSRFIGQPLDASMTPQSIIASQPQQQQPPSNPPKIKGQSGKNSLSNFAAQSQTPLQARARSRAMS